MAGYKDLDRTYCTNGHEFTNENTHFYKGKKQCRKCNAIKVRKYRQNPETRERYLNYGRKTYAKYATKYQARATEIRRATREALYKLRADMGCKYCSEANPDCLDFHHRDPAEKKFTVAGRGGCFKLEDAMVEVNKCDIVCANCHRKIEAAKRRAAKGSDESARLCNVSEQIE